MNPFVSVPVTISDVTTATFTVPMALPAGTTQLMLVALVYVDVAQAVPLIFTVEPVTNPTPVSVIVFPPFVMSAVGVIELMSELNETEVLREVKAAGAVTDIVFTPASVEVIVHVDTPLEFELEQAFVVLPDPDAV